MLAVSSVLCIQVRNSHNITHSCKRALWDPTGGSPLFTTYRLGTKHSREANFLAWGVGVGGYNSLQTYTIEQHISCRPSNEKSLAIWLKHCTEGRCHNSYKKEILEKK